MVSVLFLTGTGPEPFQTHREVTIKVQALVDDGFLDTMFESPGQLQQYWAQLLPDFPNHWLAKHSERWAHSVPIVLWGDEGTLNNSSWMIVSWTLRPKSEIGFSSATSVISNASFFLDGAS